MFNPSKTKVTANLVCGKKITDTLYRFQAEVSSLKDGWTDAVQAKLGSDLKLIQATAAEHSRKSGMGKLIEAFAVIAPEMHYVKSDEFASTMENLGAKEVAKNMYMDADETVWSVTQHGDDMVITKNGNDNIDALLASANAVNDRKDDRIQPIIASFDTPMKVIYVSAAGELTSGIMFDGVNGDKQRAQVVNTKEIANEPLVIDLHQVTAFEELPELKDDADFEGDNTLEYYRVMYSEDPEMMKSLEDLYEGVDIM